MKAKRINHVAIVVKDLDGALKLFGELFGLRAEKIEDVPEQGVRAALVPVGDTEIEFITPINPDTGVARFLESRGEGVHHICFEVEDVDEALSELESKGVNLIDKKGRKGLAGKVGFIHPKSTKGVLIELAQVIKEG